MQNRTTTPEKPTTELFMDAVMRRKPCKRHQAGLDFPCWEIIPIEGLPKKGVCNRRARNAGFNHPIDPRSLRLHRNKTDKK